MNSFRHKISRKIMTAWFRVQGRDFLTGQRVHNILTIERIGSDYGGWDIPEGFLNEDSTVYCAGCGEDISFDLGIIEKYGCTVHGFDPTPRSIEFVSQVAASEPKYYFHEIGIWNSESTLEFFAPANAEHVSHSLLNLQKTDDHITVNVDSIVNIMKREGHSRLDLLKLDIEGAEYTVLDSLVKDRVFPTVLCVEFDEYTNPLDSGYRDRIRASVDQLLNLGYLMISTEFNGNYTFMHQGEP